MVSRSVGAEPPARPHRPSPPCAWLVRHGPHPHEGPPACPSGLPGPPSAGTASSTPYRKSRCPHKCRKTGYCRQSPAHHEP
ncbi:hypothetical protein ASQ43_00200 [Parasaccharibacter apium]|uniref:C2H2-type domain-containing protein n=1 Tax=Parasaccharibacter apium TaxID=1510841 RepID=A0ABX4ZQT1_9PROT|nr:hypothetical protein ASO19_06505 [Parasaccharibacter apium]POS65067.1 hypothetical protein ASQ42_00080 [Parasaccharibacter apium]POS66129.1 hypothetical protein ASQ43_00200 [Parasaccharibacter apium]